MWGSRILDHHPQWRKKEKRGGEERSRKERGGEGRKLGEGGERGEEKSERRGTRVRRTITRTQNSSGSSTCFKGGRLGVFPPAAFLQKQEAGPGWLHRLLHSFSFCFDKTSAKAAILKPCVQPLELQ